MGKKLLWDAGSVDKSIRTMLLTLSEEFPVCEGQSGDGIQISFEKVDEAGVSEVIVQGNKATIKYSEVSQAARGVGSLLAGLEGSEKITFKTFGIMLDCSRNAVMKVDHFKKWLRRLSLMGYNMAMLYTEDTYQLPDEPYFGYMRGGYSMEDIKEIDAYAASLGIEMIGCIQTLGHLEQILRWRAYGKIKDTPSVMLVDEDETYKLITKMLNFWDEALTSRRLHIGMDEAWGLGRGKFMDKNGHEDEFDIFNRHLAKLNSMCKERGLKPLIWSDMYFRMGCESGDYYDETTVIPDEVKDTIPKDVDLVYWDYYHDNKEFYADWISRHKDLGFEPPLASGVWTWLRMWYDHKKTAKTIKPCLEASTEAGLTEFFFTMWGDGLAACEYDSALAGLCLGAELAYGGSDDEETMNKRFNAICGESYSAFSKVGEVESDDDGMYINALASMWDDPLLGINWNDKLIDGESFWDIVLERYNGIDEALDCYQQESYSEILEHGCAIVKTLIAKIEFRKNFVEAYNKRDTEQLTNIMNVEAPKMVSIMKEFEASMRKQWMRRNRHLGYEPLQNQLKTTANRYEEVAQRIGELLDGTTSNIIELDSTIETTEYTGGLGCRHLMSGSVLTGR